MSVVQFRTRHEPSIRMFDELGRELRVSLNIKELREGSDDDGWSPWNAYSHRMICGDDIVVRDDDGRYHLVRDGRVVVPADPSH